MDAERLPNSAPPPLSYALDEASPGGYLVN